MVLRLTLDPLVLARAYVWQLREILTCPELVSKIKSDNMMLARPPQEYELHEYGRILYT